MQMVHHHVKYKEIHGVDEIVLISNSEHQRIHKRLRKQKKCNVPVDKLKTISAAANFRRRFGGRVREEYIAFKKFKAFEKLNFGWLPDSKDYIF